MTGVRHGQVRIGIQAPPALRILRDELPGRAVAGAAPVLSPRKALARKITILRSLRRWSVESLAQVAGLPVETIREIESGQGLVELGEIEALARAFGITLPALLVPPGGDGGGAGDVGVVGGGELNGWLVGQGPTLRCSGDRLGDRGEGRCGCRVALGLKAIGARLELFAPVDIPWT